LINPSLGGALEIYPGFGTAYATSPTARLADVSQQRIARLKKMDTMGSSNKQSTPESLTVTRSEELVDQFLDAIWMERGLSKNTLGAYRADLMTLARSLAENGKTIDKAEKSDLLDFIAKRVEGGSKPRSTARQLSSFRRFSVT
jgi:hypothetical protein